MKSRHHIFGLQKKRLQKKDYKRQKSLACRRKYYKRQKEEKKCPLSETLHLDSKKKKKTLFDLLINWCWQWTWCAHRSSFQVHFLFSPPLPLSSSSWFAVCCWVSGFFFFFGWRGVCFAIAHCCWVKSTSSAGKTQENKQKELLYKKRLLDFFRLI